MCAAFALCPATAGAVVKEVGGTLVGLQPRNAEAVLDGNAEAGAKLNNASGHPVLHGSRVYAIYWDPDYHYHGDWENVIDSFLHDVNAASGSLDSVFAVDAQYTDLSNRPATYGVTFRGSYTDTDGYPSAGCTDPKALGGKKALTCLTDKQVREELAGYIAAHGLEKGMGTVYYLLTPPGVTVCLDSGGAGGHCSDYSGSKGETSYDNSFCSYHGAISPTNPVQGDANTILYGMIPWSAGGLGDGQLESADRTAAYECQDGGFDPSSKPVEQAESKPTQQEPNQGTCPSADGFCDRGLADLIVGQIGVEQQDITTDPLLNAWRDEAGNEVSDECRNFFARTLGGSEAPQSESEAGTLYNQVLGGGVFYLQDAFNLAADRLNFPAVPCLTGVRLEPEFSTPSPVNAGDIVDFDGMESVIDLNAAISYAPGGAEQANYATYTWNFGDGTPGASGYAPGAPACTTPWLSPCAASVMHAYTYGGTYEVTLTVTDVGGDVASVTRPVTVIGPPPPSPGANTSAAASPGSAGTPLPPAPKVAAAVSSHSLRNALRHGLIVRYSVSERVGGRFEVLISASLARHLHLHGPAAVGLPAGTAPQVVIGKAYLVATHAGHSTTTIMFSKANAARLARLHSVSLMLRLVARNAAGSSSTLVSKITLSH